MERLWLMGTKNQQNKFLSLLSCDDNPQRAYQDSWKMQREKEQPACQEPGASWVMDPIAYRLSPFMPGFHFPHSHFLRIPLPVKMSSQIETAYALPRAWFPREPELQGGACSPSVRVMTGFPEKCAFVLTLSVHRLIGGGGQEGWRWGGENFSLHVQSSD